MKVIKKYFTAKLRKVMRICAVQGIIALTLCGVSAAHPVNGQILDTEVTISLQNIPFEQALKEIENIAHVRFAYSLDKLGTVDAVTIEIKKGSLKQVLNDLLIPSNIDYKVHEKEGVITLVKLDVKKAKERSYGEPLEFPAPVTGTVTDATTNQPMPGVNIVVKGTTIGTTTDADGKYAVIAEAGQVLVFSFIGYKPTEARVDERMVINISLEQDVTSLGEVVVNAGYYTTTKEAQTGNIAKVEAKDIQKQPVSNPLAALQGRVAGLEVTQSTGVPGGNFQVRIRGTNSIANGNNPLFIIDGVPFISTTLSFSETSVGILANGSSPLNTINPSDIESIEVLKDADATTIYGSRGSNGVILITTKKGKGGKTKIDASFYTGTATLGRKLDQLSTPQYLKMRHEAFANDKVTPTTANARDLLVWDTTRFTNWQKELVGGTASTADGQVSISGGDVHTQFSLGGGYHRETTVFPGNSSDQRISTHLSLTNTSPNQKFKTTAILNYTANLTNLLNQDLTAKALFIPPNAPALYDGKGNLNWTGWSTSGGLENPVAYLKRKYEATTNTLIASVETVYSILPNLELKIRAGYTNMSMNATALTPLSSLAPSVAPTSQNTTNFSNSSFQNWIAEPQANWKPKLGLGKLNMLIGSQFLNQLTQGLAQTASGFSSEALMKNIASAPTRSTGTNYYAQYRYQALFGRVNYNIDDKYIVNITGRRDGSSRFGPGKQFANFGAVGAAWIFSREPFVKDAIRFLSFGKIRASYGLTGNDQLTDYQYLDTYTSSPGSYQNVVGLTPARLSNPNFAWETNKKLEVGLHLGFLEDKVAGSISLYRNRSSSQLVGYPLPPTTGFASIQANLPATIQNAGIEIELNTTNLATSGILWTTSINMTIPRNKLVSYPNLEISTYANMYAVGYPLTILKAYQNTGVNPNTGLYQYKDVDGDGILNNNDRQTIKFVGPYFYGGLQNGLQYKGFQFDFLFQFVKQDGRNYIFTKDAPGTIENQPGFIFNRWQKPGDASGTQLFSQAPAASTAFLNLKFSNQVVSDASFIRLKNVSLAYTLPSSWMSKVHVSEARIFLRAQNLLTFSKYVGLDPETQNAFLPPLRVFTVGISAKI